MTLGSRKMIAAVVLAGAMLVGAHTMLGQDAGAKKGGGKSAAPMTMTGVISDAMCGGNHSGKDAAKCTAGCVAKGSKYALIMDGGKAVTLEDAPAADIAKLAGQKAAVTGTMTGKDSMKVTKIEAAKS